MLLPPPLLLLLPLLLISPLPPPPLPLLQQLVVVVLLLLLLPPLLGLLLVLVLALLLYSCRCCRCCRCWGSFSRLRGRARGCVCAVQVLTNQPSPGDYVDGSFDPERPHPYAIAEVGGAVRSVRGRIVFGRSCRCPRLDLTAAAAGERPGRVVGGRQKDASTSLCSA